jgi:ABC-type transport system involved in multi-copper enzyme maturation permease subunit
MFGLARHKILSKMACMRLAAPFSSARTIVGHGIYLIAVALVLFLAPGVFRLIFAFPTEFDWWNRILALPVFNLGLFCIGCGFLKSRMLIKLTVAMRTLVMVAAAALVVLQVAPPLAMGIGVVDIASAALTVWAIATEAQNQAA